MDFLLDGSPDCPLIRLYTSKPEEFSAIYEVVQRLAMDGGECAVHDLPIFRTRPDCKLTMVASASDEGIAQAADDLTFRWILTPRKWSSVAGFVEPFAAVSDVEIHQWLAGGQARDGLDIGEIALLISTSSAGRW